MSSAPDCIFCRIADGRIPAHTVYESSAVLAFLDINPLCEGHTVVIPRAHAERLHELDPAAAAEVGRILGDLARRIVAAVGAEGYNVLQNNGAAAGQVVPHVHFHIIPRRSGDGLGFRWNAQSRTAEQLKAVRDRIAGQG
jgi:histidine triad (HIT) family protein